MPTFLHVQFTQSTCNTPARDTPRPGLISHERHVRTCMAVLAHLARPAARQGLAAMHGPCASHGHALPTCPADTPARLHLTTSQLTSLGSHHLHTLATAHSTPCTPDTSASCVAHTAPAYCPMHNQLPPCAPSSLPYQPPSRSLAPVHGLVIRHPSFIKPFPNSKQKVRDFG